MAEKSQTIKRRKQADFTKHSAQGLMENPGPYIGIVKSNYDTTRAGRLSVFIPDLGGTDPDDSSIWYTLSYASPFRGKTQGNVDSLKQYIQDGDYNGSAAEENSFQSYGFWFVPPDIGVKVLCIFVNSDPAQGYWFACVNDAFDSHMTPGIGSAPAGEYIWNPALFTTHQDLQGYIELPSGEIPSRLPVSEPTRTDQIQTETATTQVFKDNLDKAQKYPHVYQSRRLGQQGLCFDFSRGTISASSHREVPSQVFGVSTPGRYWMMHDQPASEEYLASEDFKKINRNFRVGGHQIIMDDGTTEGLDQGIRIRTTRGNQILLDDSNEQIYVVNSQGTAWLEITPSGRIEIFSTSDFNLRSKGSINLHAERDFNLHVRGKIQIKTEQTFALEALQDLTLNTKANATYYSGASTKIGSGSAMNLHSKGAMSLLSSCILTVQGALVHINTPPAATPVLPPADITENTHPETKIVKSPSVWWTEGEFRSIVERAPDHEPWKNHEVNTVKAVTPQPPPAPVFVNNQDRPSSQGE